LSVPGTAIRLEFIQSTTIRLEFIKISVSSHSSSVIQAGIEFHGDRQRDVFLGAAGRLRFAPQGFSIDLARQQVPPPYTPDALSGAPRLYGFAAELRKCRLAKLHQQSFPLVGWLHSNAGGPVDVVSEHCQTVPALLLQADSAHVLVVEPGNSTPATVSLDQFAKSYHGFVTSITPQPDPCRGPDSEAEVRQDRKFAFRWFIPELPKYKQLWQEVLLASLVIQLIAVATPLFTQTIVDKVVVHRTESTLIVIATGMAMFMLFSAGLWWLRQYLVLHSGNRADAVLGSSVYRVLTIIRANTFTCSRPVFQYTSCLVVAARIQLNWIMLSETTRGIFSTFLFFIDISLIKHLCCFKVKPVLH
jgi:subfamily B ATP-binding cassette protein HlyB/CyaB